MTTPKFAWTCSYQGTVWFRVTDETGTYEARYRHRLDDYERATLNGPDVVAAEESIIGWLVRSGQAVPAETVLAFNAWQRAEAERWNRTFDENPQRYGFVGPDDPLRSPRYLAKGSAHWQAPEGWQTWEELKEGGRWVFTAVSEPDRQQAGGFFHMLAEADRALI